MKIYISGPITGTVGYMERFDAAESALMAAGHEVINPARVNAALPEQTSHEDYMKMSFTMLGMCEVMFVLRGWKDSKGCNMEMDYCAENGIPVVFEGGAGCEEKASKPKRESSVKKLGKRFTTETKGNAYSALGDIICKARIGLAKRSCQLCTTSQEQRTV